MTERLDEMNKLKNIINSLDDSADAEDFHKFVDTCQINYEEGVFNEILRFMQSQAERANELEEQKLALIEEMGQVDERFLESEQQNKRYKQALEDIRNRESLTTGLPDGQRAFTMSGAIANKALEGEG